MKLKTNATVRNGFTLMEVIIAMAVMGIIVVMVLSASKQQFGLQNKGGKTSEAISLIQEKIEAERIGVLTRGHILPTMGETKTSTIKGITMTSVISKAYDKDNVEYPATGVVKFSIKAYWSGCKDTINIVTHLTKDF